MEVLRSVRSKEGSGNRNVVVVLRLDELGDCRIACKCGLDERGFQPPIIIYVNSLANLLTK